MSSMRPEAETIFARYRAARSLDVREKARLLGAIQVRIAESALVTARPDAAPKAGTHPAMAKLGAMGTKVALGIALVVSGGGTALWVAGSHAPIPGGTAVGAHVAPVASVGATSTDPQVATEWTPAGSAPAGTLPSTTATTTTTTTAAASTSTAATGVAPTRRGERLHGIVGGGASSVAEDPSVAPAPAPAPGPAPAPALAVASAPAPASASASSPSVRSVDAVDEEVGLVGLAYSRLRDHDPGGALVALEEHERRFPDGKLAESRRVTRVLALCQAGRVAEAQTERDRFLVLYPHSPFSNRVRRACGDTASP